MIKKIIELVRKAIRIQKTEGVSVLTQLFDIFVLRRKRGKLTQSEYYGYKVYGKQFSNRDKEAFIGTTEEDNMSRLFNPTKWVAVRTNKVLFYTILEGAGIPYPKLAVLYSPEIRQQIVNSPTICTKQDLASLLKRHSDYPLFVKPNNGVFGRGAFKINAVTDNTISLSDRKLPLNDFIDELETLHSGGYIFQEFANPHQDISAITLGKTATLRISFFHIGDYQKIHSALLKIPVGNNIVDNFMHGETGNLVASLDTNSGRIKSVIGSGEGEFVEVQTHPESGMDLTDFQVPDWNETVELCFKTASNFQGIYLFHLDIALTEKGPVVIEMNNLGNLDLHQFANGAGFADENFDFALEQLLKWRIELKRLARMKYESFQDSGGA